MYITPEKYRLIIESYHHQAYVWKTNKLVYLQDEDEAHIECDRKTQTFTHARVFMNSFSAAVSTQTTAAKTTAAQRTEDEEEEANRQTNRKSNQESSHFLSSFGLVYSSTQGVSNNLLNTNKKLSTSKCLMLSSSMHFSLLNNNKSIVAIINIYSC